MNCNNFETGILQLKLEKCETGCLKNSLLFVLSVLITILWAIHSVYPQDSVSITFTIGKCYLADHHWEEQYLELQNNCWICFNFGNFLSHLDYHPFSIFCTYFHRLRVYKFGDSILPGSYITTFSFLVKRLQGNNVKSLVTFQKCLKFTPNYLSNYATGAGKDKSFKPLPWVNDIRSYQKSCKDLF